MFYFVALVMLLSDGIVKAFLQISIKREHCNQLRFLWFQDINNFDHEIFENNPLVEYRFCRVLFGVSSSPFLLNKLHKHIKSWQPRILKKVIKIVLCFLHVIPKYSTYLLQGFIRTNFVATKFIQVTHERFPRMPLDF